MVIGYYGGDGFGGSPYGSIPPQVGVLNAASLSNTAVEVNFTVLLDFTFISVVNIANYSIPGLTISEAVMTADNAVLLTTTPQTNILYTVTVAAARSTFGQPLNPAQNTATFTGTVPIPGFLAVATTVRRVRLVFSAVMLNNSNLTNPANYTLTDLNNNAVPIVSVTLEQTINPVSIVLTLGANLGESDFYVATVSSNVKTILGLSVLPPTNVFQWLQGDNQFQVPLSLFTGEVSGGLLGDPDGLVFFSPALNVSTANSIIQVEDVDVCTTAYDTYTQPAPIDPIPLFLYGGGLVPTPSPDPYLLNQCVLWAPFPRNFEAQITVGFTGEGNQDFYEPPVDTSCSILINQQFALGYVSLLNDPAWYLFNDTGTSVPPTFITAKNILTKSLPQLLIGNSSLSAESTVTASAAAILTGQASMTAYTSKEVDVFSRSSSHVSASATVVHQAQASLHGSSNMGYPLTNVLPTGPYGYGPYAQVYIGIPPGPQPIPPGPETIIMLHVQLSGEADMPGPIVHGVAPPMVATKHGLLSASMDGESQLFAGAGPPPVVLAQVSMSGGSSMRATMKETLAGVASINGAAYVRATALEGGVVPTVLMGSSSLVATAGVRRSVAANIQASSHVSAVGSVRRGVAAALAGQGALDATATDHWEVHANIAGSSAVTATATVTHKAEAFPVGIATVSATAS